MANNELVLLDQILAQRQADRGAPLPENYAFEIFACEQVLRTFDLSPEEVESGVVGGGNDGAIDGIYVFLGDTLITEDTEILDDDFSPSSVEQNPRLLLWLVQAKTTPSFTETAIDLVESSTARLLDLTQTETDLLKLYSSDVVGKIGLYRDVLTRLATKHPRAQVRFSYVTRGQTAGIDPKVLTKGQQLAHKFGALTPGPENGEVRFLGATELWAIASSSPSYTLKLKYQENATSGTSHVALITLADYIKFLSEDDGSLRRHIFDWNVRDYQGGVQVNREIQKSLADPTAAEFWWLNNGVTIVCSKTSIVGKEYVLDDVQIVNGLQTSHAVFRSLAGSDPANEVLKRSILVRILVTGDPQVRDAVIRATNSQTNVPAASLRATDDIQRKIEAHFLANGWFYDRRKNYYRNIGKSGERIVGIPLLAQATMAMGLSRPDDSRARPSSLLKKDDDYGTVFADNTPLAVYLWLAKAQKEVDKFLKSIAAATTAVERTNLRFHIAMLATSRLFGARVYNPIQLSKLATDNTSVADANLPQVLTDLRVHYQHHLGATGQTADQAAKGSTFVAYVLAKEFP